MEVCDGVRSGEHMTTKQILRLAYLIAALAVLAWVAIGGAIWSAYRTHRAAVAAGAASSTATVAAAAAATAASIELEPFDRARSSVQYERLDETADPAKIPAWLDEEIPVPANERSIGGWIMLLREAGVQVCWRVAQRRVGEPDLTFALPFEKASVRDVLDELCRCDRRYRWEWMAGSEVVNVLADEKLDAPLGDVSFRQKRLYYCLPDLQPHAFVDGTFGYDPPKGYAHLLYWPVVIKARQITVRDYLNLSVAQYDEMTWTVDAQGHLDLDAPQATRDAVAQKYRDDTAP
jgi:hypothetical protein